MIEILQLRRRTGKSANEFAFDAAQIAPTSSAEINFDLASTIFAKNRPAPLVRSSGARSRGVRLLVRASSLAQHTTQAAARAAACSENR
jgi:hypothetical protein